ncbi:hypothetical protein AG1IA_09838 [Rhizoctonia solani AG-1 IA]|uniref:Uncharacterized protein n=1 Tax=Thanatephorus cucumeris (strain AG1-IA) TaxID=983506 RepID=L8WH74_THACA|nr:hypothetical protein AG1IA_09838 [Rhizoctonia solani AG-1 IA]
MNEIKEMMKHRVINAQKHGENVNDRFEGVEGVKGVEVEDKGLGEDKLEASVESLLPSASPREVSSYLKAAAYSDAKLACCDWLSHHTMLPTSRLSYFFPQQAIPDILTSLSL